MFQRSVYQQRNLDMLQQPQFIFADNSRNGAPFRLDQNGKMQEPTVLSSVPSMHSDLYKNPLPPNAAMGSRGYNRPNQDPRSMMNYAQAPYGNARGQMSMISDPEMFDEGKPLVMDNKQVFDTAKRELNIPKVLQRVV